MRELVKDSDVAIHTLKCGKAAKGWYQFSTKITIGLTEFLKRRLLVNSSKSLPI